MRDWFGERGLLPSGNHSVQRDPRRLQYATHFCDTTLVVDRTVDFPPKGGHGVKS